MSPYIHHVPGRLRVRSSSFRCQSGQLQYLGERLMRLEGVEKVDIKYKAGSISVSYDHELLSKQDVLAVFASSGCFDKGITRGRESLGVGQIAQRALVGSLVHLTVERSVRTLIGGLI
jgi:hypothetical protein